MPSSSVAAAAPARAALHRVFWRVHFWAGLITAPTVLFASCAVDAQPLPLARELAASEIKTLERVSITASRPASMPIEIPTTLESISGKHIEQTINATDAEDALKYFPSLNVRKRYIEIGRASCRERV